MRSQAYLMCLWPGLSSLWSRGHWRGLAAAAAFTLLLNFAFVVTFVWPELFSPTLPPWLLLGVAWVSVLCFWIAGWRASSRVLQQVKPAMAETLVETEKLFCEAQTEYLKGHWLEAEALLDRTLALRANDVEARLLRATLFRRTARLEGAKQLLVGLMENEAAARWRYEIAEEQRRIEELEQPSTVPLKQAA